MFICLGHATALAQEEIPLSVVLARALAVNPAIQAALMRAEAADSRAKQERGALLPEVRATGTWGTRHSDETGVGRNRAIRSKQLTLNQPVTLTDEYVRWQAKKAEADAELARAQGEIQKTLLQVTDAYLGTLLAGERVEALKLLEINLSQQDIGTRRQFEEGEGTKGNIATVKSRLANARGAVARAEQDLVEARERLESLLGSPVDNANLVWPVAKEISLAKQDDVLEGHPAIREAKARLSAQSYTLKAAATDIFPEVNLTGSSGRDSGLSTSLDAWENKVLVNVSIPLFRGGRTVYGIKAAQAESKAAQMNLDGAVYDVRRELRSARDAIASTDTSLTQAEHAYKEQETAIYGARLEYENGERSLTDLLNAEQEYVDARINLATARRERVLTQYRLRAAQGDLILP